MTSIQPTSTPRWDSRNQGFISPAQLQQWKQQQDQQRMSTHEFQSPPDQLQPQQQLPQQYQQQAFPQQQQQQLQQPVIEMQKTPSRQSAASGAPSHSRTMSAFAIFKNKLTHNHHNDQHHPQDGPSGPPKANVLTRRTTNPTLSGRSYPPVNGPQQIQQAPQMQMQPQITQQQQHLQYQPQPQFQPQLQPQPPLAQVQAQPSMQMRLQPQLQAQQGLPPPPVQSNPQMQPPLQPPLPPSQPQPQPEPQVRSQPPPRTGEVPPSAPGPNGQQAGPPAGVPPLHPEIRSVVGLTLSHSRKIYYSGPMIRKLEKQADGQRPSKDEGWREVWGQLGGTTLSLWDMKQIEEASKQGKQVPPSYINVTDAFVQVVGAITVPGNAASPPQKYSHVLSVNTAGQNLFFFSCPSLQALLSWTAAFRLAAWEKSRLEEIYTAHLIRITYNEGRNTPSPLVKGHLEGWVRIRVAGQTDWKKMWMVVTAGGLNDVSSITSADQHQPGSPGQPVIPGVPRKKRMSDLFNRGRSPARNATPTRPTIQLYASQKPKDKRRPLLTMSNVTQAFGVYPERPELISRSTLMKLEGLLGGEEVASTMANREAWLLVMPELEGGNTRASEMLRWLIGIHDAFELYGRPSLYSWDPRDPRSMMFAYPVGENKDMLFLDRELVESLDVRDNSTPSIRMNMHQILWNRMRDPNYNKAEPPLPTGATVPSLPPIPHVASDPQTSQLQNGHPQVIQRSSSANVIAGPSGNRLSMQLPPLDFQVEGAGEPKPAEVSEAPRSLSPITEQSVLWDHSRSGSGDQPSAPKSTTQQSPTSQVVDTSQGQTSMFGGPVVTSPLATSSPTSDADFRVRKSEDSYGFSNMSRPDSKLSHLAPKQPSSSSPQAGPSNPSPRGSSFGQSSPKAEPKSPLGSLKNDDEEYLSTAKLVPPRTITTPSGYAPSTSTRPTSPPVSILTSPHSLRDGKQRSESLLGSPASPREVGSDSPRPSIMTSPYSFKGEGAGRASSPHASMMTSPYSVLESPELRRAEPSRTMTGDSVPGSAVSGTNNVPLVSPVPVSKQPSRLASPPAASPPIPSPVPVVATSSTSSAPPVPTKDEPVDNLIGDAAGALYYMRHMEGESSSRRQQAPSAGFEDEESSDSESAYTPPPRMVNTSPLRLKANSPPQTGPSPPPNSRSPPRGRSPMGLQSMQPSSAQQISMRSATETEQAPTQVSRSRTAAAGGSEKGVAGVSRFASVARPSGARAAPGNKLSSSASLVRRDPQPQPVIQQQPTIPDEPDEENMSDDERLPYDRPGPAKNVHADAGFDDHADALAALTFLEQEDTAPPPLPQQKMARSPPPPQVIEPPHEPSPAPSLPSSTQPRSSFAPSRQAAERKAKSQAQQAASQAAAHRPGRANGKGKTKTRDRGAWGDDSSDEDEEDEDEEDEEVDSDDEPIPRTRMEQQQNIIAPTPSVRPPVGYPSAGQGFIPSPAGSVTDLNGYPPQRRGRDLPQVPGGQMGPGQMLQPDQFNERRSMYPGRQSPQPPIRPQSDFPQPGAARQNMWSQVLDPGSNIRPDQPARDTFVQLEPPSQTMTKAFTPHGLLSAGLQDKQDRSAKRQEELARESGASLINVPNKPPPPQTGLLGAVTAHERERKRDGGLGAALTEREREKRLAEDRQRKLDDYQRMQLDQMQGGGSMYGGMGMQGYPGFNPMMGNPMMGNPMMMNPMMTGNWGFPGMMNPQHMFAAQQAAQAYQQAMMAYSVAGSQVGGEGGGQQPGMAPMNPMMTGQGMGNFDPRMSMMGMPMMGGMGMNPAMTGGGMSAGMGGGMAPGMNPMAMGGGMGMQMTGGSAFDARYSPGFDNGLRPISEGTGSGQQSSRPPSAGQRPYSSQNNSANGQGSPLPPNAGDDQRRSVNASPNVS